MHRKYVVPSSRQSICRRTQCGGTGEQMICLRHPRRSRRTEEHGQETALAVCQARVSPAPASSADVNW